MTGVAGALSLASDLSHGGVTSPIGGAAWAVDCIGPVDPPTLRGCTLALLLSEQRVGMVKPRANVTADE